MNKTKHLVLILMSLFLIANSCSKDEDPITPENNSTPPPIYNFAKTFSVKIDSTELTKVIKNARSVGSNLFLEGTNNIEKISLIVPETIAKGSHAIGGATSTYIGTYSNISTSTTLYASSGTLTITEHNITAKQILGTFSFVADEDASGQKVGETRTITAGQFSLQY